MTCKYADIFGIPGKGVHRFRLGGIAVVDLVLTLGLALGLSYIPSSPPFTIWIILLLLLAMVLHALLCTKTSVSKWLYSDYNLYIFTGSLVLVSVLLLFFKNNYTNKF